MITADGQKVAAVGGSEGMLQARLIGYAYDLDKKHMKTKTLEQSDSYVIQQVSDRFAGMDYLESWGNLKNGCFFLIGHRWRASGKVSLYPTAFIL